MFFRGFLFSQTAIEVIHPLDADFVFLQVFDTSEADVIVFFTKDKELAKTWDCKWKIKKWGFSNFCYYITSNENDPKLYEIEIDDEIHQLPEGTKIPFTAKIYITNYPDEAKYRNNFMIPGLMKVHRNNKKFTPPNQSKKL